MALRWFPVPLAQSSLPSAPELPGAALLGCRHRTAALRHRGHRGLASRADGNIPRALPEPAFRLEAAPSHSPAEYGSRRDAPAAVIASLADLVNLAGATRGSRPGLTQRWTGCPAGWAGAGRSLGWSWPEPWPGLPRCLTLSDKTQPGRIVWARAARALLVGFPPQSELEHHHEGRYGSAR